MDQLWRGLGGDEPVVGGPQVFWQKRVQCDAAPNVRQWKNVLFCVLRIRARVVSGTILYCIIRLQK